MNRQWYYALCVTCFKVLVFCNLAPSLETSRTSAESRLCWRHQAANNTIIITIIMMSINNNKKNETTFPSKNNKNFNFFLVFFFSRIRRESSTKHNKSTEIYHRQLLTLWLLVSLSFQEISNRGETIVLEIEAKVSSAQFQNKFLC